MRAWINGLLGAETQWVFHPDNPGVHIRVVRTCIGRFFKNPDFATVVESIKYSRYTFERTDESHG